MKDNLMLIFAVILLVSTMFILNSGGLISTSKVDCSKPFNVVYLKPSEMQYASDVLNSGENMVVVFPELSQVNAKTEILNCDSFEIKDYINIGDM